MENENDLKKRWVKIYPQYIDKALKHSEGRKVSASIAVENPTTKGILGICSETLKLSCKEESVNLT